MGDIGRKSYEFRPVTAKEQKVRHTKWLNSIRKNHQRRR